MRYTFEWDPDKARTNRRKHRVDFQRAAEVFADPDALSLFDDEHSEQEDRWITLGRDGSGSLLVVVHTFHQVGDRTASIRIVSARKATRSETRQYLQGQR